MRRLIYTSHSIGLASAEMLDAILVKSRENNARDGITGLLIYHDGNFLQVLEGDDAAVSACYDRICTDQRHGTCIRIIAEPVVSRVFDSWRMAFMTFNDLRPAQQKQFIDLGRFAERLDEQRLGESPAVRAVVLAFLSGFREFDIAI